MRPWEKEGLTLPEALQLVMVKTSRAGADAAELVPDRTSVMQLNIWLAERTALEDALANPRSISAAERGEFEKRLQSLPAAELMRRTLDDYESAATLLRQWLQARKIAGEGWHSLTEKRAPIEGVQWDRGYVHFDQNLIQGKARVISPITDVLVRAADIRKLCEYLSKGASDGAGAHSSNAETPGQPAAAANEALSAGPRPATVADKERIKEALRVRVAEWPPDKTQPRADYDWKHVERTLNRKFRREDVVPLRSGIVPGANERGRRRKPATE